MNQEKKDLAIKLRSEGKSYNEIQKIIAIPKSTLSDWLKNIEISKQVKENNISKSKKIWAENITKYNKLRAEKAHKNTELTKKNASHEIETLTRSQLKLIGTALYWAEGFKRTKWNPHFCNSDPAMIKVMMRFFREICEIPEDRFRPQVQTHPNVSIEDAEKYWSKIAGIDRKYFRKPLIQITKSSKLVRPIHRLPYGTFRVGIAHVTSFNRIMGWIEGLINQAE